MVKYVEDPSHIAEITDSNPSHIDILPARSRLETRNLVTIAVSSMLRDV